MYFRLGGGTLKGISKPGEIVWSRIYIEDGRLKMDLGRAGVVELPAEETAAPLASHDAAMADHARRDLRRLARPDDGPAQRQPHPSGLRQPAPRKPTRRCWPKPQWPTRWGLKCQSAGGGRMASGGRGTRRGEGRGKTRGGSFAVSRVLLTGTELFFRLGDNARREIIHRGRFSGNRELADAFFVLKQIGRDGHFFAVKRVAAGHSVTIGHFAGVNEDDALVRSANLDAAKLVVNLLRQSEHVVERLLFLKSGPQDERALVLKRDLLAVVACDLSDLETFAFGTGDHRALNAAEILHSAGTLSAAKLNRVPTSTNWSSLSAAPRIPKSRL